MTALSSLKFEQLYIGLPIIAANGVPGKLVVIDKEKDLVVAFWNHGNASQFSWFDGGDGPWQWRHVTVDKNPKPDFVYPGMKLRYLNPNKLVVGIKLIFDNVFGEIYSIENYVERNNKTGEIDRNFGPCVFIKWEANNWKTRNYWNNKNFGLNHCDTIYIVD